MAVECKEQCKKCFHFQVCASVLKNDLFIREVLLGEKEPKCEAFVEVVRCKDCKYCQLRYPEKQIDKEATPGWYCKEHRSYRRPDDFCSHGERRDG